MANDKYKDIIIDSLQFLVKEKRIYLCAFVIMINHIHIIWQISYPHTEEAVQRDFLKFTAQMMIKDLRNNNASLLEQFRTNARDRKYQIWERNALSIPLRTESVVEQKLNYIHENPVRARICEDITGYKYSSAGYYETGDDTFGFITHYKY